MNILTTYTLKNLRLNKKRSAVTILGVILSTSLICGVFLLGSSFQKVMIDHEIFMSGNWHAEFQAVPYANAKKITENSAVQTAMLSQLLGNATYASHNTARPYLYVTAYDSLSFKNQPIQLMSGRLPQKDGELLVSESMIRDSGLNLKPGSILHVTFGKRNFSDYAERVKAWGGEEYVALQNGETFIPTASKTYTIVGVMAPTPNDTSMPADFPAFTYLNQSQLSGADIVDVSILARDPRSINTTAPEIAKSAGLKVTYGSNGLPTNIIYNNRLLPWLGGSGNSNYVGFFLATIIIVIFLIVAGSILLIYNSFAISIGERKKQFGMFTSMGTTASQIRRIVLTEALAIAVIGIPLGIFFAIVGVDILTLLTRGIISQLILDAHQGLQLVISPIAIGVTVLFSIITILLSAWIPARRAARVSPIEAIRQSGEVQENLPNLRINPLIRQLFGFEGELAMKSLKRDRKRYLTTLLSLMLSIILFVSFNSLMSYTTETQNLASKARNFDLQVNLNYNQTHVKNFIDQVSKLPEVQQVAYRRSTYESYVPPKDVITTNALQTLQQLQGSKNIPIANSNGTYPFVLEVSAVGQSEFTRYAKELGLNPEQYSDPNKPMGILLDHIDLNQGGKLYDFDLLNLKSGDTITVTKMPDYTASQTGSTVTSNLTWIVGAVNPKEAPLSFLGTASTVVTPRLIVSDTVFDGLNNQLLQLGPINPGDMYIKSNGDTTAAVDAIRQVYQSTIGGDFSYHSTAEMNKSQELQTLMTNLFFYGFLGLITLIGVANIINTLDSNIKLRRREIAMLRSVGLTPSGFRDMLYYESLFYGLTALLYGLPLGIGASFIIYLQFGGISSFAFTLPLGAIAACIIGVMVIVFTTMLISGAMIRKDNIVETLKEENF